MVGTKTVLTGLSMATILIFGGGIFLYMNLSHIAKPIAERIAADALGVSVSIASMKIDLPNRSARVNGLRVANPEGYKGPNAITVSDINVELGDVSKELIVLKKIDVLKTNVNLEVFGRSTNLNDLKNGISGRTPATPQSTEAGTAPATPGNRIKVIVDEFNFNGAQLNPTITLLKAQALDPVIVPDINLVGIGRKENGILAREAVAQIFDHVLKTVNRSSGQAGFLNGLDKDALKDMGQGQIDVITDQVKDEVKNIGNQIKGIFGN